MPIDFNMENIKLISSELIGQKYGWGGLYGHRDCSAMTKDFYAPFGIFLQRNSGDQKNDGIYMDIKKMDKKSKKQYILDNAIPWTTLVYMKGHIMIYIGSQNDEPLVFHNVWGIRTLQDDGSTGRFVVGQAVVSTLEMGKDLPNVVENSLLIDRVEGITLIAPQ
jgi:cell wall-associated NlpC family hydrolase